MEKNFKNKEGGRVIAGLILVAVGAALLLRNIGVLIPGWLFTWPVILILAGIYTGFKHNFRNNLWIILIAIGGFFLVSKLRPSLGLEPFFWPAIVIGLGLMFILRPERKNWINYKRNDEDDSWKTGPANSLANTSAGFSHDSTDYLRINSVFSGVKKNILTKNLQGGHISCVFGGAEIDFTQADITGPVHIKIEVVFGGVKLVVPPHWAVQNEIEGFFHGVDDQRRYNSSASIDPGKVLILKGSAVFGGVEVRSY